MNLYFFIYSSCLVGHIGLWIPEKTFDLVRSTTLAALIPAVFLRQGAYADSASFFRTTSGLRLVIVKRHAIRSDRRMQAHR